MGMDLKLLPQYSQTADFAHDVLSCGRDYDMFNIIKEAEKQKGKPVQETGIYSYLGRRNIYEEHCYSKTTETPYGKRINSVQAVQLKKALVNYEVSGWKNKAIIAFLNELPDELKVWLYWC